MTTISGAGQHAAVADTDRIPASKASAKGYHTVAALKADTVAAVVTLMSTLTIIISDDDVTELELAASDSGAIRYFTAPTTVTVTVPAGLGAGFFCSLVQAGTGQVTVAAAGGVTPLNADSQFSSQAQYIRLTLWTPVANTFILEGRTA